MIEQIDPTTFKLGKDLFFGDRDSSRFKPHLEIPWCEGAARSMYQLPFLGNPIPKVEGDRVIWRLTPEIGVECYVKDSKQFEDGVVEIDIVLYSKPPTNTIVIEIDDPYGGYHRQPPFTESYRDGWSDEFKCNISVAETDIIDLDTGGDIIHLHRPLNIVGSYAVIDRYLSCNQYRNGKRHHIPRPRPIDAVGKTCWADMLIESGKMIITIPKTFLDSAVYPVHHSAGATFGKTAVGLTTGSTTTDYQYGISASPASNGSATQITYWQHSGGTTGPRMLGLYHDDGATNPTVANTAEIGAQAEGWRTHSLLVAADVFAANTYWLVHWGEGAGIAWDTLAGQHRANVAYPGGGWPATLTEDPATTHFSIYVTYTPASGGGGGANPGAAVASLLL